MRSHKRKDEVVMGSKKQIYQLSYPAFLNDDKNERMKIVVGEVWRVFAKRFEARCRWFITLPIFSL